MEIDIDDRWIAGQVDNASDEQAVKEKCYFNADKAQRIVQFANTFFRVREGHHAGEHFTLLPWQEYILAQIFGWQRRDGTRRFRRAFITVAAGQGKNVLVEIIALYCLLLDGEHAPYVVSAANSRSQAGIVWRGMNYQISQWPDDKRLPLVRSESKLNIKYPKVDGEFKCIPADGGLTLQSESVSCAIINEFAWWPKPDLFHAILSRFRSRKQPLLVIITTAGADKSNECHHEYVSAKAVLNSEIIDTEQFAFVAEADEGCDITDPVQWRKANVSGNVCVKEADLAKWANAAKFSATKRMVFYQQHLNLWQGKLTRFLDLDKWDDCCGQFPDLAGQTMYIGVDLANKIDLCAAVGLIQYGGKVYVHHHAWIPEQTVLKQNTARYREWEASGSLTIVEGNASDFNLIRKQIHTWKDKYRIGAVIIEDREAHLFSQQLIEDRFTVFTPPPTVLTYSEPLKALEKHVLNKTLVHDGAEAPPVPSRQFASQEG